MKNLEKACWTISDLIVALLSFRNPDLEVRLSSDGGRTSCPITMMGNSKGRCRLDFDFRPWLCYFSPETGVLKDNCPEYLYCGKKIPQCIKELRTFEDHERIVDISVNDEDICPLRRIEQRDGCCLLIA